MLATALRAPAAHWGTGRTQRTQLCPQHKPGDKASLSRRCHWQSGRAPRRAWSRGIGSGRLRSTHSLRRRRSDIPAHCGCQFAPHGWGLKGTFVKVAEGGVTVAEPTVYRGLGAEPGGGKVHLNPTPASGSFGPAALEAAVKKRPRRTLGSGGAVVRGAPRFSSQASGFFKGWNFPRSSSAPPSVLRAARRREDTSQLPRRAVWSSDLTAIRGAPGVRPRPGRP